MSLLEMYKESELSEGEKALEKLREFQKNHPIEVFPKEQKQYLTPLIKFFQQANGQLRTAPPRIIAEVAMALANFRKSNTKEGYLSERDVSRKVQESHRELDKEEEKE